MSQPPAIHARAVLAEGSKSFGFAARFLSPQQWDDAAQVYAFCRMVDDVADDEAVQPGRRRSALAGLRDQLRGEEPSCAEVAGLLEVHRRCDLDLDAAVALIDGCESDLQAVRIQSDEQLLRYGYRVASTVGLLMCGVLGVSAPLARHFAIDLGVAMQVTNICRDVLEDAENGRVYLPEERLLQVGVSHEQLLAGTADSAAVSKVVLDLLTVADGYYASAWEGMRYLPWRARFAIVVAARIYRRIVTVLRGRGGDALAGRAVVSLAGKLFEAGRACVSYLHPRMTGFSVARAHDSQLHAPLAGLPGVQSPTGPVWREDSGAFPPPQDAILAGGH